MNATKNEQQQMIQKTQSKWQTESRLFELVFGVKCTVYMTAATPISIQATGVGDGYDCVSIFYMMQQQKL